MPVVFAVGSSGDAIQNNAENVRLQVRQDMNGLPELGETTVDLNRKQDSVDVRRDDGSIGDTEHRR